MEQQEIDNLLALHGDLEARAFALGRSAAVAGVGREDDPFMASPLACSQLSNYWQEGWKGARVESSAVAS